MAGDQAGQLRGSGTWWEHRRRPGNQTNSNAVASNRDVVGIYGSIKGEDCVAALCGRKISLYTGRP